MKGARAEVALETGDCSALYEAILPLHSEKSGDQAKRIRWPLGGTSWRHELLSDALMRHQAGIHYLLTSSSALVNLPCKSTGLTPLHLAAFLGVPSLVKELLKSGADEGAKSLSGRIPLDEAMYNGNIEAAQLLLGALGPAAREAATMRLVEYASLPGAALMPAQVHAVLGRKVVRRPALIDPPPQEPPIAKTCNVGGGWVDPMSAQLEQEHSDIDQRTHMSATEYYEEYYLKNRMVLLRGEMSHAERCRLAADRADGAFSQRKFSCGATAYPGLTGRQYCGEYTFKDLSANPRCLRDGTRPVCNYKKNKADINATLGFQQLPANFRQPYTTAPLSHLRRVWHMYTSCSFWGGTAGSGSGFHYHNSAVNVLFFGIKRWQITPPRYAGLSDLDSTGWPDDNTSAALPEGLPYRFTQHEGDVVILPSQWGHATTSVNFTLGIGMLWCEGRVMNMSRGECHLHNTAYRQRAISTGRHNRQRKRRSLLQA